VALLISWTAITTWFIFILLVHTTWFIFYYNMVYFLLSFFHKLW